MDLIEVNHVYNCEGQHTFSQVIFHDWSAAESAYRVRAWRLLNNDAQLPTRHRGAWRCRWQDGKTYRDVRAPLMRTTHTQYDVEIADRDYLPKEHRRGLAHEAAPE